MRTPVRFALLAALPREVRGLTGRTRPDPGLLARGIHLYRLPEAVVVTAGMGSAHVALAFAAALEQCEPAAVVSLGLAGGCDPQAPAGTVLEAGLVVSAQTGERFRTSEGAETQVLVSTESIAGVHEKARLAAAYRAVMVDMEAATVARLARAHDLPFRAIKGISDAHDFEIASLSRFSGPRGQFRTAAFAMHTALRPYHWRPAARLGRDSSRALEAMHTRLFELMKQLQ